MFKWLFLGAVFVLDSSFTAPHFTLLQRVEMVGRRLEEKYPCRFRTQNGSIQVCRFRYVLTQNDSYNARNRGIITEITQKMATNGSDDEIAWILGHEFGHKNHAPNELAADVYGGYLAQKAGFEVCAGITTLKRFSKSDALHPPSEVRVANFRKSFPHC
jgi:predicted Zn-dependent protease